MGKITKLGKRIIATAMSLAMVFTMLPENIQTVEAANTSSYESITIGKDSLNGNAIWGATESYTGVAMDNSAHFYAESRYSTGGLPNNGELTVNSIPYTLATGGDTAKAYDGKDCIRLTSSNKSKTMNLETIGVYNKIYVLATAGGPGEGNYADFSVTLTYTDNSTGDTTYKLYDWYDLSTVSGVDKYYDVMRMNNNSTSVNGRTDSYGGPVLHSAAISVDSNKLLKSITFTMKGKNGDSSNMSGLYCCIFAVTGATPAGVPSAPTANVATSINKGSGPCFTANWSCTDNTVTDYYLDVATDRNFTNILSGYNNKYVGKVTSFKVDSGLSENTTYYYRVRAKNSNGQSLSSNRVATGIPTWAAEAGLTDETASYDAETGVLTVKKSVNLTNTIKIPTGDTTTINITNNAEIKAPAGTTAVSGEGANTNLIVTGNGTIKGGDGTTAGPNGSPAIDMSQTSSGSTVSVNGNTTVKGGDGVDASGENQNGGNGADAIKGSSGLNVSVNNDSKSGDTATIVGGNGGNGIGTGNGGNGGAGVNGNNVQISVGNGTGNGKIQGGSGGAAETGTGGTGGLGVNGTKVDVKSGSTIYGGNGGSSTEGSGGNGGFGTNGTNISTSSGSTISGGNGGSAGSSGTGGNGGQGVSASGSSVTINGNVTGGNGGDAQNGTGGSGGNAVGNNNGGKVSTSGNGSISGGNGGNGTTGGNAGTSGSSSGSGSTGQQGKSHTHEWIYSVKNDQIIAYCTAENQDSICKYNGESNALTFDFTAAQMQYNGKPYNADGNCIVITNNITAATMGKPGNVAYYNVDEDGEITGEALKTAPTNIGKYAAKITLGGQTISRKFEITKARPVITLQDADYIYNGQSVSYTGSVSLANNEVYGGTINYSYRKADTQDDFTNGLPMNAGVYEVKAAVDAEGNYSDSFATAKITIEPKPIKVTAENKSKIYGDVTPEFTYTVYDLINGEHLENINFSVDNENAGSHSIVISQKAGANPNYAITFVNGTLNVAQRQLDVEWSNTTLTYNGQAQTPTATLKGVLDGDKENCLVTVDGSQTDAGSDYTATAKINNANYVLKAATESCKYVINNASQSKPDLTAKNETFVGQGNGQITGLTQDMEWKKADDTVAGAAADTGYQKVSDVNMNFSAGKYYVRCSAKKNYNASLPTEITIEAGRMISITVPSAQTGYELTTTKSNVSWNGSTTLTFKLKPGYSKLDNFAVKVNGEVIELTAGENGTETYTLNNIEEDKGVTVEGVADITVPTGTVTVGSIDPWTEFLKTITFNRFFKETQNVTITADDAGSGVSEKAYYVYELTGDNTALTYDDVAKLDADKWTKGSSFMVDPDKKFIVYAKLTDKDGNTSYISSDGIVLDNTAPAIDGIENNESYCENTVITVTDANIDEVSYTVDGKKTVLETSGNGKYTLPIGEITPLKDTKDVIVTAVDKAGNKTEVAIKAEHDYSFEYVVPPTILDKGWTTHVCRRNGHQCGKTYNDTETDRLGESGLKKNDKSGLEKVNKDAQQRIDKNKYTDEAEKEFFQDIVNKSQKMLDDIEKAEQLKKAIDDINIPGIKNPTDNDSEKLNDALNKINDLLDDKNQDTPTSSLTDEQKKQLENLRSDIENKQNTIAQVKNDITFIERGDEKEPGVFDINKKPSITIDDQAELETVLDRIDNLLKNSEANLTQDQNAKLKNYHEQMLTKLKDAAKQDIENELAKTKKQIESSITDQQKKKDALSDAEQKAKSAKENIDNAATKNDVVNSRENGRLALDAITGNQSELKDAVKDNINRIFENKKNEIESMNDLTAKEKSDALAKLQEDKENAISSLENKKSKDDIINAFEELNKKFEDTINENLNKDLSNAKKNAIADINQKVTDAKAAIDAMPNLSDKEKADAKAKVDEEAKAAKADIDAVTKPADKSNVAAKKNDGITKLDSVESVATNNDISNMKGAAKSDIDSKATEAKKAIDAMPDLTPEQKSAAKADIDAKATESKAAVDAIQTPADKADVAKIREDIKSQKDSASNYIDNKQSESATQDLSNAKENAKNDIDKKAQDAKDAIDAMPKLSDDEKAARKADIDKAATAAKAEIDKISDPSQKGNVSIKKDDGFDKLDQVESDAADGDIDNIKAAAKSDIDKSAKAAKDAIDAMPNLTPEEKSTAKAAIDKKAEETKKSIDGINASDGKDDIESIRNEINEQKNSAVDSFDKQQSKSAEQDLSNAKDTAKADIDKKAEEAKTAIDAMPKLTDKEKEAAKAKIDEVVKTAKAEIDKVTDPKLKDNVDTKLDEQLEKLDKIELDAADNDIDNIKAAAKSNVDSRADETIKAIDKLPDLTAEQKKAAKAAVEAKAEEAKTAIDGIKASEGADISVTKKEIENQKNSATDLFDQTKTESANNDLANAKDKAKDAIDTKAAETKAAIDAMPNLTEEEKAAKKADVDKAATAAKADIDTVTDPALKDNVSSKKETGDSALDQVESAATNNDIDNMKSAAKSDIDSAATDAKAAIEAMTDLTAKQKEEAKAAIDKKAEEAKKAVDNIKAPSGKDDADSIRKQIESQKDDAASVISEKQSDAEKKDLSNAKDKAKAEINQKATDAKAAIDAMPNLSDKEKEAAKAKVDKEAEAAKTEIDAVTKPADKGNAATKKNDGFTKLDSVESDATNNDISNMKESAKSDIDSKATEAKKAIDAMSDLTPEQKTAAKADIDAKATESKAAVDAIQAPESGADVDAVRDAINKQKSDATDSFDKKQSESAGQDLSNAKDKAKADIDKRAEETKKAIDAMPNLTDKEREEAKANVDKAAEASKAEIDKVTDPALKDSVDIKKDSADKTLDQVENDATNNDLSNMKEAAKSDIDSRADAAKDAIDQMEDLTPAQKADAKADIDKKAEEAKGNVDNITDASKKDEIGSHKDSVTDEIKKKQEESSATNAVNAKDNVKKAEEAVKKAENVIGEIKISSTDETAIKTEVKSELNKSGIDNADVKVNDLNKTPAKLHEKGKITGTVEIKVGSTTKTVEVNQELPELSTFVDYDSKVEDDAPKSDVSVDADKLMDNILSDKEISALENGSTADILLHIKNKDVETAGKDKDLIEKILTDNEQIGKTLDISLLLNITDSDGNKVVEDQKISEAETMFTITVDIPKNLLASGNVIREYQIVRVHDGVAEMLDSEYDEDAQTLTFATDRFSTYAITYSDTVKKIDNPSGDNKPDAGDSSNGGSVNAGNQPAQQPAVPSAKADAAATTKKTGTKTGDNNNALPFVLLMLAGATVVVASRKKKVNR